MIFKINMNNQCMKKKIIKILFAVVICILQGWMLEFSTMDFNEWGFIYSEMFFLINLAIVTLPNIILIIIFGNYYIALLISSIFCTAWSVINYYVILFHGAPLSVSTLLNIRTAVNVIKGYQFIVKEKVLYILLVFLIELGIIYLIRKLSGNEKRNRFSLKRVTLEIIILVVNVAFIYVFLFSSYAIKEKNTIGWSWKDSAERYGYLCYLLEDAENTLHPVTKPEGYSVDSLPEMQILEEVQMNQTPDIILILNESFFDLNEYTDIKMDADYLGQFYGIEGATYGHAISPMIGGGTNNSEYELLTSNSMYLLNADAPFNYLDLEKGQNVIRLLNTMGYETCGMHCAVPTNYMRDKAYPAMGMEHVVLGKEQFETLNCNGNRPWLDSDNYRDMINLYEELGEEPRFIYLLTYQNHGGYEQNSSDMDKIHTKEDYGDLTDDINEYLTSVQMSSEAFRSLIEYLKKSERPVIVCMVGDHAPSFINELPAKKEMSEEQSKIAARSVPYVIWSNFDMSINNYSDYVSMVDLMPMIINAAGLPLSSYYKTILDLHEDIPVRTSYGTYMKKDGTIETLTSDNNNSQKIMEYYYLEYNELEGGSDYQEKYFNIDFRDSNSK